jgi:hypothetical protein
MLVNKPQFDKQQLEPGTPVMVTAYKWDAVNNSYAWPAIVTEFTPLKITVARFNPDQEHQYKLLEEVQIYVEDVASSTINVKIEALVTAKGEE